MEKKLVQVVSIGTNTMRKNSSPQPKSENDLCGYWSRIFNAEMENMILEHTNTKLEAKFDLTAQIEAKMLDKIELRAFFVILIYSSVSIYACN